jgi:hypothetical protein
MSDTVTARKRGRQGEGGGRPTLYSEELLTEICDRLARGETLRSICNSDWMPEPSTVWLWRQDSKEVFERLARARHIGFDAIAEHSLEIADTPKEGVITTTDGDGKVTEKRVDMIEHRKLQVDTRLKLLRCWDPSRYGDKVTVTSQGQVQHLHVVLTEAERVDLMRAKQAAIDAQRALDAGDGAATGSETTSS